MRLWFGAASDALNEGARFSEPVLLEFVNGRHLCLGFGWCGGTRQQGGSQPSSDKRDNDEKNRGTHDEYGVYLTG